MATVIDHATRQTREERRQPCNEKSRSMNHAFLIPGALTLTQDIVPYEEIASFYDEGFITNVLFAIKSGKEATVYCAEAHAGRPERYYALKHYRPLAHRAFRNDAVYQEGRFGRETRDVRAMRTKTRKGRIFQFGSWIDHEYAMLLRLHAAGADVPVCLVSRACDMTGVGETLLPLSLPKMPCVLPCAASQSSASRTSCTICLMVASGAKV